MKDGASARARDARRTVSGPVVTLQPDGDWRDRVDYVALTKPRLNLLVVATSAAGYYLGRRAPPSSSPMARSGRRHGARGRRRRGAESGLRARHRRADAAHAHAAAARRPRRAGRRAPSSASCSRVAGDRAAGAARPTLLAALLALAHARHLPVAIYTPMKRRRRSPRSSARSRARCRRSSAGRRRMARCRRGGWALFAIVFLWQIPHFMAIAWLYRDDYGRPGSRCCRSSSRPAGAPGGRRVLYAAALLPVSLLPTLIGLTGSTVLLAGARARRAASWSCRARFSRSTDGSDGARGCSSARSSTCRSSGRR